MTEMKSNVIKMLKLKNEKLHIKTISLLEIFKRKGYRLQRF